MERLLGFRRKIDDLVKVLLSSAPVEVPDDLEGLVDELADGLFNLYAEASPLAIAKE